METDVQREIPAAPPADDGTDNVLLRAIVRFRWIFFLFIGALLIAGYNGQWRVGRDSSRYRELARNVAAGKGYTYRGQGERQIYRGLPFLLVGIERVFGKQDALRPRAALLVMTCLGLITLIVVYYLVLAYYPPWIAVCVTTGVGINLLFLEYAFELMTDLPFLLGSCLALLGIARLGKGRRFGGAVVAVIGVVIAAWMRPTFWALALAGIGAAAVAMIRSPYRRWFGMGAMVVVGAMAMFWAIGGRHTGLFSGKYERIAIEHMSEVGDVQWWKSLDRTLERHIPDAFFGFETFRPMGTILSLMLLGGSVLLMRKSVLWGLYVLVTFGMTVALGSVPRYYMMILPLVLVEYALISQWIADRFRRWRYGPSLVMLYCLGFATFVNVGQSADFIMEQHGMKRSSKARPFLEVYRGGKMLPVVELSKLVARVVPPGKRVIGPEPQITTFLSGRPVYDGAELSEGKAPRGEFTGNHELWHAIVKQKKIEYYIRQDDPDPKDKLLTALLNRERAILRDLIDRDSEAKVAGMYVGRFAAPEAPATQPAPTTRPMRSN